LTFFLNLSWVIFSELVRSSMFNIACWTFNSPTCYVGLSIVCPSSDLIPYYQAFRILSSVTVRNIEVSTSSSCTWRFSTGFQVQSEKFLEWVVFPDHQIMILSL
jgi:hypothetical protein